MSTTKSETGVSVIIPCYNQGAYLPDAIESMLAQTHSDIEIIVVNDGSTDSTAQVAKRWQERVVYVEKSNGGLPSARNAGLAAAAGRFVQFLDADDMLERGKIQSQVEYLVSHPEIDIVFGDVRYFHSENPGVNWDRMDLTNEPDGSPTWMSRTWESEGSLLRKLVHANIMPVNASLARRDALDRLGGFDERLESLEDWDYWLRAALNGSKFAYHPVADGHALVRTHPSSMSRNLERMLKAQYVIRTKLSSMLPDDESARQNIEEVYHGFCRPLNGVVRIGHALSSCSDLKLSSKMRAYMIWLTLADPIVFRRPARRLIDGIARHPMLKRLARKPLPAD